MPPQASIVITTFAEEARATGARHEGGAPAALTPLGVRVQGEYREMPGLRLTVRQAARLFSVAPEAAEAVLDELQRGSILTRSDDGVFALSSERPRGFRQLLVIIPASLEEQPRVVELVRDRDTAYRATIKLLSTSNTPDTSRARTSAT